VIPPASQCTRTGKLAQLFTETCLAFVLRRCVKLRRYLQGGIFAGMCKEIVLNWRLRLPKMGGIKVEVKKQKEM
jgi:hypothetical protein